jgi:hypothetical protein
LISDQEDTVDDDQCYGEMVKAMDRSWRGATIGVAAGGVSPTEEEEITEEIPGRQLHGA